MARNGWAAASQGSLTAGRLRNAALVLRSLAGLHWARILAVLIALDMAVLLRFLFAPGLPMHGDLAFPLTLDRFRDQFYPLWNPYSSVSNLENLDRILLMFPLIEIGRLLGLSMETFVKGLFVGVLLVSQVSMYAWGKHVVPNAVARSDEPSMAALGGAILYGFAPWVMPRMSALFFWIAYAVAPLTILLFTRGTRSGRRRDLILAALAWTIGSGSPHFALMLGGLGAGWALYLFASRMLPWRATIKALTVLTGSYLMLNVYWIWPIVSAWHTQPVTPGYTVSSADLTMLSANSSPLNVLLGRDDWFKWWHSALVDGTGAFHWVWIGSACLIYLVVLLALSTRRMWRLSAFFVTIGLSSFVLLQGVRGPARALYSWLLFEAPGASSWGWLVRAPEKFGLLFWFVVATLFTMGITRLSTIGALPGRLRTGIILMCAMGATLLFTLPKLSAGTWGPYVPIDVPDQYTLVNNWLERQAGDFKVLWLAPYEFSASPQGEAAHTWAPDRLAAYVFPRSSATPSYGGFHYINPFAQFRSFLYANLQAMSLWKLLSPAGIRYVVYQADIVGAEHRQRTDLARLTRSLRLVYRAGSLYVFESPGYSPFLSATTDNRIVYGGLRAFRLLSDLPDFDPRETTLIFHDASATWPGAVESLPPVLYDVSPEEVGIFRKLVSTGAIVWPFDQVSSGEPGTGWARLRIASQFDGRWPWHTYLQEWLGARDRWEFDYGHGIITTHAPSSLSELQVTVPRSGDYRVYARIFRHSHGGRLSFDVNGAPVATLDTSGSIDRFTWELVGTARLREGQNRLRISAEAGHTAIGAIGLLPADVPTDEAMPPFSFLGESIGSGPVRAAQVFLPSDGTRLRIVLSNHAEPEPSLRLVPEGPAMDAVSGSSALAEAGVSATGPRGYFLLAARRLVPLATLRSLHWAAINAARPSTALDGSLNARVEPKIEGWQTWRSSPVPVPRDGSVFLSVDFSALDVANFHLKVEWLNSAGVTQSVDYATVGQTGTFGRLVGKVLKPPPQAAGLRLQVVASAFGPRRGEWRIRRLEMTQLVRPSQYRFVWAEPSSVEDRVAKLGQAIVERADSVVGPHFVTPSSRSIVRLAESYDPYWLGTLMPVDGSQRNAPHAPAFGVVNGFLTPANSRIKILYGPHFATLRAVRITVALSLLLAAVLVGRRYRRSPGITVKSKGPTAAP